MNWHLLWLLLLPPFVFIWAALCLGVFIFCQTGEEWWSFPLWVAFGLTIGFPMLLLGGFCILNLAIP